MTESATWVRITALVALLALGDACSSGSGTQHTPDASGTGSTPAGGTGGGGMAGSGAADPAGGAGNTGGEGAACDARARLTMATHEVLNVTWPAGPATLAGNGQVSLWGKMVLTASGNTLTGFSQPCGTALPATDLHPAIGGGKIVIEVPTAAWEAPSATHVPIEATQTGWNVGSSVSYAYAALIGFSQAAPATTPWPVSYIDIMMTTDFDTDGHPGVTGVPRSGGGYVLPPTSALGPAPPADKLYLVDRNVASTVLMRTSCDEASGTTMFMHFDSHVMGCHVSGGAECSPTEVKFIDDNRTIYTVTSATTKTKIVPDDSTCAAIQAALPM